MSRLDLSYNRLTTMPGFAGMVALTSLDISGGNQIADVFPTNIGSLVGLTSMKVQGNKFTGTFPASFNSLVKLAYADLSGGNQLTGALPPLGGLTALSYLNISGNLMGGLMPSALGGATLGTIDTGNQRFCGCFPTGLNPLTCAFANSSFCCGGNGTTSIPFSCGAQSLPCQTCTSCTDNVGCVSRSAATTASVNSPSNVYTAFAPGGAPTPTLALAPAVSVGLSALVLAAAAALQ